MSTWSSFPKEKQYTDKWRTFLEEGYKKTVAYCDAEDEEYETSGNLEDFDVDACGHPTNIKSQDIETYQHMVGGKSISHPGPEPAPAPEAAPTPAPAPEAAPAPTDTPPEPVDRTLAQYAAEYAPRVASDLEGYNGAAKAQDRRDWMSDLPPDQLAAMIKALDDIGHTFSAAPGEEEPEAAAEDTEAEAEVEDEAEEEEPILNTKENTLTVIDFLGVDDKPLESIHYPTDEAWSTVDWTAKHAWATYYWEPIEDGEDDDPLKRSWNSFYLKNISEIRSPAEVFRRWLAWEVNNPEETLEVNALCDGENCPILSAPEELYHEALNESQVRRWHQLAGINTRVL